MDQAMAQESLMCRQMKETGRTYKFMNNWILCIIRFIFIWLAEVEVNP